MTDLPRRTLLSGCAGAVALLLAACGRVSGSSGDGTASGRLDGLRLSVAGGFTTAAVAFRTVPELTLTPDGRVLTPDPVPEIYPGPTLLHLTARDIDADGRETLSDAVRDSGLLTSPPPDFGEPGVADAPSTTLRVTLDGTETTLRADALVEAGGSGLTARQQQARRALAALVDRLRDLEGTVGAEHLGDPEPYVPTGVWLRALPRPLERVPEDPQPVVVPWPVAEVDLATLETPTLVEGEAATAVLAALEGQNELTLYRVPDDRPRDGAYEVLARPAIPGDPPDGSL